MDISFLTVRGSGHGFTSSSIRHNAADTSAWHEINPGGSRIRVEKTDGNGDAFRVFRTGDPRLSSVVFENFCLDGVSFGSNENSYVNGKTGIRFVSANDACRVEGVGMVYLEHGLVVKDTDALSVSGNFLAECGSCIELTGSGQASKVTDNLIGAGYVGFSIYAEGHAGLLVTGNNVQPAAHHHPGGLRQQQFCRHQQHGALRGGAHGGAGCRNLRHQGTRLRDTGAV